MWRQKPWKYAQAFFPVASSTTSIEHRGPTDRSLRVKAVIDGGKRSLKVPRANPGHSYGLVLPLSDLTMDEVVKRFHPSLFQECSEFHVTSDVEISVVLLLDRPDMSVVAFVSKQAIFIARSLAAHSRCIFCHSLELQNVSEGRVAEKSATRCLALGSYEETPSLIAVVPRIEIAIAILDAPEAAEDPAESRRSRTLAISRHS